MLLLLYVVYLKRLRIVLRCANVVVVVVVVVGGWVSWFVRVV